MKKHSSTETVFNDLTLDAQTRFNSHKHWDQKLYNQFVNK